MLGESVGIEHVLAHHVLHMDEGVGAGEAGAERLAGFPALAIAIISVAGGGEIGGAKFGAIRPFAFRQHGGEANAIMPRRSAENARQRRAGMTARRRERIVGDASSSESRDMPGSPDAATQSGSGNNRGTARRCAK